MANGEIDDEDEALDHDWEEVEDDEDEDFEEEDEDFDEDWDEEWEDEDDDDDDSDSPGEEDCGDGGLLDNPDARERYPKPQPYRSDR